MRDWVEKFESGEYLQKWRGYEPIMVSVGPYSQCMNIGESKFMHCTGWFSGIGDVDWWITAELEKLSKEELYELESICAYKKYVQNFINIDLVKEMAKIFGCDTFHIYRTGNKNIIELSKQISDFWEKIEQSSLTCLDPRTIDFNSKPNIYKILSFDEFKTKHVYES